MKENFELSGHLKHYFPSAYFYNSSSEHNYLKIPKRNY